MKRNVKAPRNTLVIPLGSKRTLRLVNPIRFFMFTFAVLTITILFISMFCIHNNAYGYSADDYRTITVSAGDTLWSIAGENKQSDTDIRAYIYEIKTINKIDDNTVFAGQKLQLPANDQYQ